MPLTRTIGIRSSTEIASGAVLLITAIAGCKGSSETPPPVVAVSVPVASASAAPIVITAPPPSNENDDSGDVLSNSQKLPNGETAIGMPAPGFSLRPLNPQSPMAEIRAGRVTIVNFWATWCAPCTKDLPNLNRIYAKHHGRGLDVIALSVDDEPSGIDAFVQQLHVRFPVAWDDGHQIANLYQPSSMPSTFIIDRAGRVRFIHGGYHMGDEQKIEEELKDLL